MYCSMSLTEHSGDSEAINQHVRNRSVKRGLETAGSYFCIPSEAAGTNDVPDLSRSEICLTIMQVILWRRRDLTSTVNHVR